MIVFFELVWCDVIESLVDPLLVVEPFDVLHHADSCLGQVAEGLELGPLVLERPEESFDHSVVVATSGSAHRTCDVHGFQYALECIACVLAATIAVMQQLPRVRVARLDRMPERFGDYGRCESFAH